MATAEFLDLRPLYFADRRFVAKEAVESRYADASKWLRALDKRRDLSVAARNQVLFDTVHLLADDWTEQKANAWNFINLADLDDPLAKLNTWRQTNQPVALAARSSGTRGPDEVLAALGKLVEEARSETYPTYAAFVRAEKDRRLEEGERFAEIEDYSRWFAKFRPYLALDLEFPAEMDDDAVEPAIQERIDFFLGRLPENSGLEHHYGQIARQFIDLKLARDMKLTAFKPAVSVV
ncbi:MAG: hypothetical protein Q8Q28_11120 [Pseudomonadota bacterium]|nr:hypothetical protein [Pseudomonadota bacterium]